MIINVFVKLKTMAWTIVFYPAGRKTPAFMPRI